MMWEDHAVYLAGSSHIFGAHVRVRSKNMLFEKNDLPLVCLVAYLASSKTSIPETVALFRIGSKVRFNFPCAEGFTW
jgi:hypothetical protein